MSEEQQDTLHVTTVPAASGKETDILLTFHRYELGTLSIPQEHLGDFLEGLRQGFRVVVHHATAK